MPILVHFEDEGTAGTLLVVFKMHGLQQRKTAVSSEHFYMFAIMRSQYSWVWQLQNLGVSVHTSTSKKNLNKRKIYIL